MREHTNKCHGGVFSPNKMEEAIHLNWAQGRGVIKLVKRILKMNKKVLNFKFEHWHPRPVFIEGR